ncbi:hypothetical protein ISF_09586 [Cordyceps fumosorosea ARSEF 2679]|uniref:Protein kinase-like domain protein n=1 Tax=Cordyceps fumosorosea (strain ARSEF 2679) TaxID=1081104 RepID=A0A162JKT4_CORFA|nr:hypothetical protein ISF_09586 [Cordyceps fumosorosea ARSEF 2679]OAA45718.1 hypothetical protein ISF_09586 [Cordyceps fumosorosea ARSEF 2679]
MAKETDENKRLERLIRESESRRQESRPKTEEIECREEERRMNQRATLGEYLYNCHFDIYQKLGLASSSHCFTGLAPSVDGKYYPKWLRPWRAFTDGQRQEHFNDVMRINGERRLFHQESTTRDVGERFTRSKADCKSEIRYFEFVAVECPAQNILDPLWADEGMRRKYQATDLSVSSGIRNFHDLDDDFNHKLDQGVEWQVETGRGKQQPDGGGIRTDLDGNKSVAFVYDLQAPHKIAVDCLEAALAKERYSQMSTSWPMPSRAYRTRKRKRLKKRVLPQHSYNKCYVFLFYDRAEPLVLRWHLCVPDKAVTRATSRVQVDHDQVSHTAVAELASFCLLSLSSPALTGRLFQEAVDQAAPVLKKWKTEEYVDPLTGPELEVTDSSLAPFPRGTDGACDGKDGRVEDQQCRSAASTSLNRRETDSISKGSGDGPGGSGLALTRPYCTQACLAGLKLARPLDSSCPNVLSHGVRGDGQHPITAHEFADLVTEQLQQDPYQGCEALLGQGKAGASGVLFKLELVQFGYTFVGKGSVSARPRRLEYESRVYQRLDKLQGELVPVHMGLISFHPGYILPGGAYVVHMMLMSWAGEMATDATTSSLQSEIERSLHTLCQNGVGHGDERAANCLWNAERGCVMVIDFDCAILLQPPKNNSLVSLKCSPPTAC